MTDHEPPIPQSPALAAVAADVTLVAPSTPPLELYQWSEDDDCWLLMRHKSGEQDSPCPQCTAIRALVRAYLDTSDDAGHKAAYDALVAFAKGE